MFRSDTFAAAAELKPSISSIGAAMSSATMAIIYLKSPLPTGCSFGFLFSSLLIRYIISIPAPAPIYSSPASIVGGISPSLRSSFEIGELSA